MSCSRFEQAVSDFEQAIELARRHDATDLEHSALNGLVITLLISHRMDEMAHRAEQARVIAERSKNKGLKLETLAYLAQEKTCYGELSEAIELNEEICREADKRDQPIARTLGLLQRGELHFHQTEYARAIELLTEGTNQALEIGDCFKHLYGLFMLGMAQANAGKIADAFASFNRMKAIAERNNDRFWLVRYPNCVGWIYRELQDVGRATMHDQQGAEITGGTSFQEVLSHSLINLGHDYLEQGRTVESLSVLEQAQEARDRDGWMRWRHNIRLQAARSECWLAQEEFEAAEKSARELVQLAGQYKCRKYVAIAHKLLGEIAAVRGQFSQAEVEFKTAISLLLQYPAVLVTWKAFSALGRLHQMTGRVEQAREAFSEAAAIISNIAASVNEEELREVFLGSPAVSKVLAGAA